MKTKNYILELVVFPKNNNLKKLQLDLIRNSEKIKSNFNSSVEGLSLNSFVPQIENDEILIRFILDDSRQPTIIRCGYPIASGLYVSMHKAGISPIPVGYNYIEIDDGNDILQDTSEFGPAQLIDIFAECCRPESNTLEDIEDIAEFSVICDSVFSDDDEQTIFDDIHDVLYECNHDSGVGWVDYDDFIAAVKLYLDLDFSSPVNDSPLIAASECRTIESFKQDAISTLSDGIKNTIVNNKKYIAIMAGIIFIYLYTKLYIGRKINNK